MRTETGFSIVLNTMVRLSFGILVAALFLGVAVSGATAALPAGGTFVDDDGHVHEANIEALAEARIALGCNPPAHDRFCPDETVTRGQMAAFSARALGLVKRVSNSSTDDNGSPFDADIERIDLVGITLGCTPRQ